MYQHTKDREFENLKFMGMMHGAKFKDKKETVESGFVFGDPNKDYGHMTKEAREELTQKAMGEMKRKFGGGEIGASQPKKFIIGARR